MIFDFFASLSFYAVPYLTGRLFVKRIIPAYLVGTLAWFIIFFVLSFLHSLFSFNFSQVVRVFAIGISTISLFDLFRGWSKESFRLNFREKELLALLVLSSLLYFLVWQRNTPYPLSLNWDIYEHITLANLLSEGKIGILTTRISDTFTVNSYSVMFHVLLALPSIIFQRGLIGVYYFASYWHYLLAIIASYFLCLRFTNSKLTGLLGGALSALVFESIVVYSSFFLIPQNFAALLSIFLLIDLKNLKPKLLVLSLFSIFLVHYIVGALCILILATYFFAQRYNLSERFLKIAILASLLVAGMLIGLNYFGSWQIIRSEEAVHFTFNLSQNSKFFADWYGVGLLVPFVLGSFLIFRKKDIDRKLLLIFAIVILGISLAPLSYFLKFYALGRYFVNFVIAIGLSSLLLNLSALWRAVGLSLILFSMLLVFYKNQLVYKNPLHFKNFETQISKEEINTGEFLEQRKTDNSFLVSEPATQYILDAISKVNSQGGAYMSLKNREKLIAIDKTKNIEHVRSEILEIHDQLTQKKPDRVFFVVGGRYFAWQGLSLKEKQNSFYNVWSPREMSKDDKDYVDFLANSTYFSLVYKNNELAIFEVR